MIIKQTAEQALNLAKSACQQQMYLRAETDTPLSMLCDSTLLFDSHVVNENTATIVEGEITDQTVSGFVAGTNNTQHNVELSTLVDQVKTAVENHLSFSRNVVLGNVNEYIKRIENEKKNFDINPVSLFNIEQVSIPELLFNPTFAKEMDKAAGVSYLEPRGTGQFEPKTILELTEMIQFGSKNIDDDIMKWLANATKTPNFLIKVWEHFFVSPFAQPERVNDSVFDSSMIAAIENNINGIDVAIAIFLFARAVREKLPKDSKMGQVELKALMGEFMDVTAKRLFHVLQSDAQQNKNGVVVRKFNTIQSTIYVNKSVYMRWLKEGGKVETLLGTFVKNIGATTIEQLNNVATEAQDAWARFVAISATKTNNAQMNQFLGSLETHFFLMLKDVGELEKDMFTNSQHIQEVSERFVQELKSVKLTDLNRIDEICSYLMCKARYFYTPSFKILGDMNAITKADQNMDVKEAALIAMINYVTDYVSDQILVKAG